MTTGHSLASGMKTILLLVPILTPVTVSTSHAATHAATFAAGKEGSATLGHSGMAHETMDDGDGRDIPDGHDGETDTPSSGNGTDNSAGEDREFIENCHNEYDGTTICEQAPPHDEHDDGNENQQGQNRDVEQNGQRNRFPDMTIPSGSPDDD